MSEVVYAVILKSGGKKKLAGAIARTNLSCPLTNSLDQVVFPQDWEGNHSRSSFVCHFDPPVKLQKNKVEKQCYKWTTMRSVQL